MTYTWPNNFFVRLLHFVPQTLNGGVYLVIWFLYSILVSIAKSEVVTNRTVNDVFTRVQLIIGVFMMFRLAMTIIQGIINPDKVTDSKSGMGNVIMKIITSLVLLTLLVPINVPKPKSQMNNFEKQVSGKGILFGTLYDFQSRMLEYNVLAKLILGTQSDSSTSTPGKDLSAVILKSFFTPNLKEGATDTFKLKKGDSGGLEYQKKDLFCDAYEGDQNPYPKYYKSNDPIQILGWINKGCQKKGKDDWGNDNYFAFNFNYVISLIVGILVVLALASICIEVAKRAIKLAILRIIAPIPFISYMNPKSDFENGTMGAWVKTLTSTYLELFIQLSIVYFVIFIIQSVWAGGLEFDQDASGIVWLFAHVFIYIGLLLFAKDAPKFFKQALGIKEDAGGGIFSGIAGAIGLAGAVGAAKTSYQAAKTRNEKDHPNSNLNFGRNLMSGFSGAIGGVYAGGKGKTPSEAIKNIQDRNARVRNGETLGGKISNYKNSLLSGQPYYTRVDQDNAARDAQISSGEDLQKFITKKGASYGGTNLKEVKFKDNKGKEKTIKGNFTLDQIKAQREAQFEKYKKTGKAEDAILKIGDGEISIFGEYENFEKSGTTVAGLNWVRDNGSNDEEYLSLKDAYEENRDTKEYGDSVFEDAYLLGKEIDKVKMDKRDVINTGKYRSSKNSGGGGKSS